MYNLRVLSIHSTARLRSEIERVAQDKAQLPDHLAKGTSRVLKLQRVPLPVAQFLFQELALEGGDVVLPPRKSETAADETDVLLFGSVYQLQHLVSHLRTLGESELDLLADDVEQALALYQSDKRGSLTVRDTPFNWGKRTYVMGIVNVTPDSFSGDGVLTHSDDYVAQAVAQAEQFVQEGVDILDIGGESTRPGSEPIPADEEYRRVVPVIAQLRARVQVPISVDTYRADTAQAALDAGADIVNDVWGLRMDPGLAHVVADRRVPVVIMHNRSKPKNAEQSERLGGRYVGIEYGDLMGEIIQELREQVATALEAGIAPDKIIVDPGVGFGKTLEQNLELLNRSDELRILGYPLLIGPSRKGFIGFTLDLSVQERVEGTAAAVALSITRGADIVRVHDVKAMVRVSRMTDALVRQNH